MGILQFSDTLLSPKATLIRNSLGLLLVLFDLFKILPRILRMLRDVIIKLLIAELALPNFMLVLLRSDTVILNRFARSLALD